MGNRLMILQELDSAEEFTIIIHIDKIQGTPIICSKTFELCIGGMWCSGGMKLLRVM